MKNKFFKDLKAGLDDAIAHKEGKLNLRSEYIEIHKNEQWLFNPKNKKLAGELKEALKQKADRSIDLSSFEEK